MSEQDEQGKGQAYNGSVLGWGRWIAIHWALERFPRLKELGMDRGERDVLVAIAKRTREDHPKGPNYAFPGQQSLMDDTGWSESSIRRHAHRLAKARVIRMTQREDKSGRSYEYEILPEVDGHVWQSLAQESNRSWRPVEPVTVTASTGHGDCLNRSGRPVEPVTVTGEEEEGKSSSRGEEKTNNSLKAEASEGGISPAQVAQVEPVPTKRRKTPTERVAAFNAALKNKPAVAVETKPDDAQKVATRFYALIGSPARELVASRSWAATFRPLVIEHTSDVVLRVLEWAAQNPFWRDKLAQYHRDSAERAVHNFRSMLNSRASERPTNNPKPALVEDPRWKSAV